MFIRNGAWVIISRDKFKWGKVKSYRLRISLMLLLIGTVPMLFIWLIPQQSHDKSLRDELIVKVQNTYSILANQIGNTALEPLVDEEIWKEILSQAGYYEGRVLVVDRYHRIIRDTYNLDNNKYSISDTVFRALNGETYVRYNQSEDRIEAVLPIVSKTNGENLVVGALVANASAEWLGMVSSEQEGKTFLLVVILAMVVTSAAIFLASQSVKPLELVIKALDQVKEGDLQTDFSIQSGFYETEAIAERFRQVLQQINIIEKSRQEFVSNVSHELKTPITSIRVLADSLMSEENAPVELYREFMGDISEEIDRETKIINDLLALVKLDKQVTEMNITQVNLNELTEAILKRLRPIAKQRGIEIVFESFRPVVAEIDEMKFSLALTNLVENAIKYNNDEGWVRTSLNADHKYFYVKVADSGVGIPEDVVDRIFDRFYRVDKARSRETGGTGLGLSITKSVVLLHRGAIKVDSKVGEGTVFTVRVPLTYLADGSQG